MSRKLQESPKKQPKESKEEAEPVAAQNDKASSRNMLAIVAAIILVFVAVYVTRANDNANEALDEAANVTESDSDQSATYAGWVTYNWEDHGISFKYPEGWLVGQDGSDYRLYVKNSDVDLMNEETPADFQQVWLSFDQDEASAAREEAIKIGKSNYRVVNGEVSSATTTVNGITINTYEYKTLGGPTLEAYWTAADGTRWLATTSTEVGESNQGQMIENLKKLLASLEQK